MNFRNRRPTMPVLEAAPETAREIRQRKPRILVAGEFSAGKTQFINGLIGARLLPSNVTATALPPIWLTQAGPAIVKVGLNGETQTVPDLGSIEVAETLYCAVGHDAPILEHFDIIDTPGNSDPNIPAECWQRMLDYADAVVWCTNATQAWRQSEKSVWQQMPARLRRNALVVITHADLLSDEQNAGRVLRRVQRESRGLVETVELASLLDAGSVMRLAERLVRIAGIPDLLTGEENGTVDSFIESNPSGTPGRVTILPAAATPAPAPSPEVPQAVRPVPRRLEVRREAPPAVERTTSLARQTWETLSQGLDPNDPAALLAAVDRLLDALDGPAAPAQTGDGAYLTSRVPFEEPALASGTGR